jgi:hypothetical protein
MKPIRLLIFYFISLTIIYAQNFTGGYNFYIPPFDSSEQIFLPKFNIKPINSFVTINENGNFSVDGSRIKFWGINLVAEGAFIDKNIADKVAARIRKMGFNLVRFHHIDNPWGSGSLFYGMPNTRTLNLIKLDILHHTIAKLKEQGIYSNINLNVSRTFKVTDGIAYADSLPEMGKYVTIFDRNLIALQKEYAFQLLTTTNPYTGLPLCNDPAMAMVEIINENSIFRAWRDGILTTKNKGGVLSYFHSKMLDSLWNEFLFNKYYTTTNLANAWNNGIISEGINLIKDPGFENFPISTYWSLEQNNGTTGFITKDIINPFAGLLSAKVTITGASGTYWHLQFRQTSITTKKDSTYLIKFAARANTSKKIFVAIMLQEAPYTYYGGKEFQLNENWQEFAFTFTGSEDAINKTKLAFQFAENGTYWFDNVSLATSPINGLLNGESLELRNIARNEYSQLKSFSLNRIKDNSEFYINLTNSFFTEMTDYLKNTLNVKVPIVGTNWNIGFQDLISQSTADYIDNHAYWDHPQFPNIPWSNTDWFINNNSMTKELDGSTIPSLFAGVKIKGKPYTISEYNHPFPNRFQAEAPLFIGAYSSFHDIDGIMYFDYNDSYNYTIDKISGYFSIHNNPVFMALNPSISYMFRNGLLSTGLETYDIKLSKSDILSIPAIDNGNWSGHNFFDKKIAFAHKSQIVDFNAISSTNFATFPTFNQDVIVSDNNEITINKNGLLTVSSPKFIGVSGYLNQFNNHSINNFTLVNCSDFGTITIIPITGDSIINSSELLLTAVSKVQNTGMIWNGTNTINNNWGSSPTLLNPINFEINLTLNADSIYIYPLNNIGEVNPFIKTVFYPNPLGNFNISIQQSIYKTPWFGIKSFIKTTNIEDAKQTDISFNLLNNYPNPFNSVTNITFSVPKKSFIKITIYDILGNEINTICDEEIEKGIYTIQWNGLDNFNNSVSSGIYFINFNSLNYSKTIKAVLLK